MRLVAVDPVPTNCLIGSLSIALEAAANEAARLNPCCLMTNRIVLPREIFRRTPPESFEQVSCICKIRNNSGVVRRVRSCRLGDNSKEMPFDDIGLLTTSIFTIDKAIWRSRSFSKRTH